MFVFLEHERHNESRSTIRVYFSLHENFICASFAALKGEDLSRSGDVAKSFLFLFIHPLIEYKASENFFHHVTARVIVNDDEMSWKISPKRINSE